jgi:hypothetical protein
MPENLLVTETDKSFCEAVKNLLQGLPEGAQALQHAESPKGANRSSQNLAINRCLFNRAELRHAF